MLNEFYQEPPRTERYLAAIAGESVDLPSEPLSRVERYLAAIAGESADLPPEPLSRIERYLAVMAGQDVPLPKRPESRIEMYLAYITHQGAELPEEPYSRAERYLAVMASQAVPAGRNLIIGTLNPSVDSLPKILGQDTDTDTVGAASVATHGIRVTVPGASRASIRFGSNSTSGSMSLNGLLPGKTYTLSTDMSWRLMTGGSEQSTTCYVRMYCYYYRDGVDESFKEIHKNLHMFAREDYGTDMTLRAEYTFTVPEGTTAAALIIGQAGSNNNSSGDYLECANLKLEEGDTATPWTPAPEDAFSLLTALNRPDGTDDASGLDEGSESDGE